MMNRAAGGQEAAPRLVLSLFLVAMAGCASGPPSATAPMRPSPMAAPSATPSAVTTTTAAIDPCALLPKDEAERLARTPLMAGVEGNPITPSCTYTGPVSGPLAQVEIYFGAGAKKTLDIDRELGHKFKPVSNLGDEAYEEAGTIFFRKGDLWVEIRLVLLNDPAENRKPLEEAARSVAARL